MHQPLEISLEYYPKNVDKNSALYLNTTLDKLVEFAVQQAGTLTTEESYTQLWANLIFNYYGKWCLNEEGNRIQVDIARLAQAFQKKFPNRKIPFLDIEIILETKLRYILEKEKLLFKGVNLIDKQAEQSSGNLQIDTTDLDYNIGQVSDPENKRDNTFFTQGITDFSKKYNPKTKQWQSRSLKVRGLPKPGALHSKKSAVTLFPTDPKKIDVFFDVREGIGLIFDLEEADLRQGKYIFKENTITNYRWWYPGTSHPTIKDKKVQVGDTDLPESISLEDLKNCYRNSQIEHEYNELLVGLPKKSLKGILCTGIGSLPVQAKSRLNCLLGMHYLKLKLQLDTDLPIFLKVEKDPGIKKYSHTQRLEDIMELFSGQFNFSRIYNNFVIQNRDMLLSVLSSSWSKVDNQELKAKILSNVQGLKYEVPITKEEIEKDLAYHNPSFSPFGLSPYTFSVKSTSSTDKALSALAIIFILPTAGIGIYKMIDLVLAMPDSTCNKVFKGIGITIAALTVLPALGYGLYCSIKTLAYDGPTKMQIKATDEKICLSDSPPKNNSF